MKLDEKLKKIEDIAGNLENSDITIAEGVVLYEEGIKLAKECLDELNQVKGKITVLKKDIETYREESLD